VPRYIALAKRHWLYLGLDTLNMDDGNGTNVGFGGSKAFDVLQGDL